MNDHRPRSCFNRFRHASEELARKAQRQRKAEGQRMRVEHCKNCGGWHLFSGLARHRGTVRG
jgi:hypothetical protein